MEFRASAEDLAQLLDLSLHEGATPKDGPSAGITMITAEWINLVGNPISSFYGWVVDSRVELML